MIGIYKITSPSKRVYIGQSINIEGRFAQYKLMNCHKQVRLFNSFKKYGIDSHKFEIIIECEESQLNDLERYYQDLYHVISSKGLNCKLTKSSDRSGAYSEELKDKFRGINNGFFGKKHTEETRAKLRLLNRREVSDETKEKLRQKNLNKVLSEDHKRKIGEANRSIRIKKGLKKVIHIETEVIYDSAKDASEKLNLNFSTMRYYLSNANKRYTPFQYL